MATNYDKFLRSTIGSDGRLSDYSAKLSPRGDFTRLTGINVILASWNAILSTPHRTMDHDPEFGSGIYKYVFEPEDDQTTETLIDEIKTSLARYDDRAIIKNVAVTYLQNNKGFTINITFKYEADETEMSLTIDQSSYFNYNTTV